MLHHRRYDTLGRQPYLMARTNTSEGSGAKHQVEESQTTKASHPSSPTAVIVAVVLGVVGLLLVAGIGLGVYRARKRKRERMERLASVPISNKRVRQDVAHMQLDLETAVESEDKVESDSGRPERAILIASSDGTAFWHGSVDGKSVDTDSLNQAVGWVPQIKSGYGTTILAPKPPPNPKKQMQHKLEEQEQEQQPPPTMHVTAPSLTGSEVLSMSPPPSYSLANTIGGVLGRVMEVDTSGEVRADVIDVREKTPISPVSVGSALSEAPSPTLPINTAQPTLGEPTVILPPLPSPARSSSFVTSTAPAPSRIEEHVASASKIGHSRSNSSRSSTSSRYSSSTSDHAELPRLMTVSNTFVPRLDDELAVRIGDTVRMLEEFKDGWCTVQHLGKFDAPKGVVPRVCLQERRSIVPAHKSSSASVSSSVSGSYRR